METTYGKLKVSIKHPCFYKSGHCSRMAPHKKRRLDSAKCYGIFQKKGMVAWEMRTWMAMVYSRTEGKGCPVCSGRTVLAGFNDLATKIPELASEWHPAKNEKLTPQMITPFSTRKVWWLGKCGHEWQASVYCRTEGTGCPICAGKTVLSGFNDLGTINPKLAADWHPTKNGDLTPQDVTAFSRKMVWWLCSCGHEWQTSVAYRGQRPSCSRCTKYGRPKKKFIEYK